MVAPIRNIDFEALRSLRDRHGAVYPRGRTVFRQGDTSAEFYVVLQGSVELSIADPATGGKKVLFSAPPGDCFGEMSCFGGQPRSATAIASDDGTVLLQFNQDTAIQLLRASPRFALGVIQRLCDRVNNANGQIAELAASLGQRPSVPAGSEDTTGPTAAAAPAEPPPAGDVASSTGQIVQRYLEVAEKERTLQPLSELLLLCAIGDMQLRLGEATEAAKWLARASQHAEFKKHADLQRLVRERWTQAREVSRG